MTNSIPESIEGLPTICGYANQVREARAVAGPFYLPNSDLQFEQLQSGFACALHMHQPLIPAGGDDLQSARVIGNLEHMMQHMDRGDNHNADVFHWCYRRMGEFIPQLVDQGAQPRIMLDYSGCLLHGLRQMGLNDVFEQLLPIACDPRLNRCVEWLGTAWGHPVAPSTPMQDYRAHVEAWLEHFAGIFGLEAVARVRGFSLSEMALPNHPDVCFELVKILRECGYRWVLVQEHTVERVEDGASIASPHVPHLLVARNSEGEELSIVAIVKTQGSDTKLVAQMQPYYEAQGLGRVKLGEAWVPQLVTQIADGENGGVMMNEFPPKYLDVMNGASHTQCAPLNVSEYLEYLDRLGVTDADLPRIQPRFQAQLWHHFRAGGGPQRLASVISDLERVDHNFNMQGGSWTNDISWVQGYEHVLDPMQQASASFARMVNSNAATPMEHRYRNALYHLLISQTSCFRYWGSGVWTDYGRELCRRATAILDHDF